MPPAMRFLLLPFYGTYLKRHYHITCEGMEQVKDFPGPCIVFSNHTHTLDPFFISACYPYHIRWVAGAYLFKNRFVGYLLNKWVHGIPKQQGRSDFHTIRDISNALKQGDIVGLFPEGTRTWDGDTLDIGEATAKLVRIFKVPVVFIHLEGGYALKPRWTDHDRKGSLHIKVLPVLIPEEIASYKSAELTKLVSERLAFSHDDWQRQVHKPFPSKEQAQGLQRLLYICPCCRGRNTMKSSGTEISCIQCGASATLDPYDMLHPQASSLEGRRITFDTVRGWHRWEREQLEKIALTSDPTTEIFPSEHGVLFQRGEKNSFVMLSDDFTVQATCQTLTITCRKPSSKGKTRYDFCFQDIESMIICAKLTLEFFIYGTLYRLRLDPEAGSLKYQELYQIAQKPTTSGRETESQTAER